jgi:phage gpG-like protein
MTIDQFAIALMGVVEDLENDPFQQPLEACAGALAQGEERAFDSATDASGSPWPPHSPYTVRKYGPHPLLILSGAMKRAATGGAGNIAQLNGRSLAYGVDQTVIPYAPFQNRGTSRIPRRQFMYIDGQAAGECRDIVAGYVRTDILGAS